MRRCRLASALLPAALALALPGSARAKGADAPAAAVRTETITAARLAERIAANGVVLVDVRTAEEFAAGHIKGAVNMPLDSFDPSALPSQPGKDVVLYCRSGRRSGLAAERVAASGKPAPPQLEGGILAWETAGLPVDK
jgi:rhodanese-related sulfurtransferase